MWGGDDRSDPLTDGCERVAGDCEEGRKEVRLDGAGAERQPAAPTPSWTSATSPCGSLTWSWRATAPLHHSTATNQPTSAWCGTNSPPRSAGLATTRTPDGTISGTPVGPLIDLLAAGSDGDVPITRLIRRTPTLSPEITTRWSDPRSLRAWRYHRKPRPCLQGESFPSAVSPHDLQNLFAEDLCTD
jgi:hypothetical protein